MLSFIFKELNLKKAHKIYGYFDKSSLIELFYNLFKGEEDKVINIYRKIYDHMYHHIEVTSIPQTVLILADYQYKNAFVADHELNTVACLTEIMAGVKFK